MRLKNYTSHSEKIRKIIQFVPTLSFPASVAELVQQLSHSYIAYYDNISQISQWISDVLCRGVTGSGFSKRQLYRDDEDIIYQFRKATSAYSQLGGISK
jgi:hypothetical protein